MKKIFKISIMLFLVLNLTGCTLLLQELLRESPEPEVIDEGRFTYTLPEGSQRYTGETEGREIYSSTDYKMLFGINGTSELGDHTSQEAFDLIIGTETYTQFEHQEVEELQTFITKDMTECQYGSVLLESKEDGYNYITVVIAPSKNIVISIIATSQDREELNIDYVHEIRESINFTIATSEKISGNTFDVRDSMNRISFDDTDNVTFYFDKNDLTSNYYSGKFKIYTNQEAIDKINTMKEYGLTSEELNSYISTAMDGHVLLSDNIVPYIGEDGYADYSHATTYTISPDDFYYIEIVWEQENVAGKLKPLPDQVFPFFGFYVDEINAFDTMNMDTYGTFLWEKITD